jgi:hypothetical protein
MGPADVELLGCLVDAGVASGMVSHQRGYRLKVPFQIKTFPIEHVMEFVLVTITEDSSSDST